MLDPLCLLKKLWALGVEESTPAPVPVSAIAAEETGEPWHCENVACVRYLTTQFARFIPGEKVLVPARDGHGTELATFVHSTCPSCGEAMIYDNARADPEG